MTKTQHLKPSGTRLTLRLALGIPLVGLCLEIQYLAQGSLQTSQGKPELNLGTLGLRPMAYGTPLGDVPGSEGSYWLRCHPRLAEARLEVC